MPNVSPHSSLSTSYLGYLFLFGPFAPSSKWYGFAKQNAPVYTHGSLSGAVRSVFLGTVLASLLLLLFSNPSMSSSAKAQGFGPAVFLIWTYEVDSVTYLTESAPAKPRALARPGGEREKKNLAVAAEGAMV